MEYSSGVTVLLFCGHEDQREVVGDQRVLHGAGGQQRADQHAPAPAAGRRVARPATAPRPGAPPPPAAGGGAPGPTTLTDDAGDAGHEGEPDADRAEVARRASADRAGRRHLHPVRVLGGIGRGVLDHDGVGVERGATSSEAKWPTTTTGIRGGRAGAGCPCWPRGRRAAPWQMVKSGPASPWRGCVPGHDRALEAEGLRAERVPVGQGLVDRVEVVERAAQALDEQEDERDGQEGEDDEDAPARPPAPGGGTAGPWWTSDVGGLGGGVGSVVVPVTTARRVPARRRARRPALRHPQRPLPAPAAQDQADGVDEQRRRGRAT